MAFPVQRVLPLSLAMMLLALGGCASKPDQAAWRIEPVQAVSHGMGSAQGYYAMGRQIERQRDWGRAADCYRQALQMDPGHVDARNALAVVLARMDQLADAEAQLRQALAAAPQRADLHSNLGFLLLLARRPQEAQQAFHTALALDPQNRIARANLQLVQGHGSLADTAAAHTAAGTAMPSAPKPARASVAAPGTTASQDHEASVRVEVSDRPTLPALTQKASQTDAGPLLGPLPGMPRDAADAAQAEASADQAKTIRPLAPFTLELTNGMGRRGAALQLRERLQHFGLTAQLTSNQPPYLQPYTVVIYLPGHEAAARQVARALPLPVPVQPTNAQRSGVRVLVGHDWPSAVQVASLSNRYRE